MSQTAVFVDAGYLYAQGGVLLSGSKLPREQLRLDPAAASRAFAEAALFAAPDVRLLRIYWYDGLIRGGSRTAEQIALARTPNIKLRLGMVNSRGEQKGVDSLIVTDLIELGRNGAISDAVILSGDEDIRVGVQVTQTYGVRVHLIGIKPALGSQSPDLIEEADTHQEWAEEVVARLLSVKAAGTLPEAVEPIDVATRSFEEVAHLLAIRLVGDLGAQRHGLAAYVDGNRGALPSDVDRPALAKLRDVLGRDLLDDERKLFRQKLRAELRRS